ncbi:MAG: class II aldolase/adducin family protein [Desulfovibrio sp.]|jgi:ribulose-5-phosphate 4-epimerase/fuculose-1-phosphate aldolase|nr:class II aldolase/adducin family protein [Desulfovibrio sp.]
MNDSEQRQTLLRLCREVCAKGLVCGSGGNISIRCGGDILITPTGRNLGALSENDAVRMRPDGSVYGAGIPSRERHMHCRCYARTDVACVVHVHSTYATALACLPLDPLCAMPVYTPGCAISVGKLPVLPYLRPGSEELAAAAGEVIAGRNSVLLARHGVLTVGSNAEQALNIAEEIEENARIFFILAGRGAGLTEEEQAELTRAY